jgi:hypothetical protein
MFFVITFKFLSLVLFLYTYQIKAVQVQKLKLLALMMEAVRTSETSVNFYETTRRNIPEDGHLQTRR